MLADRWSDVKQEWNDLERDERIIAIWESTNLAATVALPLILLFTLLFYLPELPPRNMLLGLILLGLMYGISIIFQGRILDYWGIETP